MVLHMAIHLWVTIIPTWKASGSGRQDIGRNSYKENHITSGASALIFTFLEGIDKDDLLQRVICNRPRTVQTGREERFIRQIRYSFSSSNVACRWSKHLKFLSLCGRRLRDIQDILRGQYQQLSADPGSLANLDQGNYTLDM